jgi:hypothetical protein
MPHYKCAACRIRLHISGTPAVLVADRCRECGSFMEPVVEPAELIGFRAISSADSATDRLRSRYHKPTAGYVDGFLTRRAVALERDRVDAESWLDHDDHPDAAAVALPVPRTGENPF